jgi:hypothetical protein
MQPFTTAVNKPLVGHNLGDLAIRNALFVMLAYFSYQVPLPWVWD